MCERNYIESDASVSYLNTLVSQGTDLHLEKFCKYIVVENRLWDQLGHPILVVFLLLQQ